MNRTPLRQRVGTLAAFIAMTAFLAHVGSASADTVKPGSDARIEFVQPQPEHVSPTAEAAIPLPAEPAVTSETETDEFMGGADPDPARFDRDGIEKWWRRYSEQHGKAER